jgi:hypothetical protein
MRIIGIIVFIVCIIACQPKQESVQEQVAAEPASRLEQEHVLVRPGYADSVNLGLIIDDSFRGSSRRAFHGEVGGAGLTINYGSPGVRGRVIWNGLVSYDQVWVSGSHWATAFTTDKPLRIAEVDVPAGTYALFTIPGKEEWVMIVNKVYDQHLAEEYTEDQDVVRATVTPEAKEFITQRLTWSVLSTGETTGELVMEWEFIRLSLPFEVIE